ncbi:MAG: enoyl-CoA hydratase/isomerase family protein [Candidatus Eisenbacteria bacterium]|uniref:Enoyl-CoA hydratase/isomerase family protein n=1 Tax=Eiseniibacteriota bacterium TaxID=2212470 RepID=A0A956RN51_UNCEI|nr:enoyl-CoA hydratase/isomerase family protein [Candidatus Eisenbacteria bacterium]
MSAIVIESVSGGEWLHLRLGRANAVGPHFLDSLDHALDGLPPIDLDGPARPVLVTGEGNVFSAGLDLPTLYELDRTGLARFLLRFDEVLGRFACLDRPTIAVVNGHAVAGGAVLALACDYRIGATTLPTGKPYGIGLKEGALGLPLPEIAASIVRTGLGGSAWMPEIVLTADLFDPEAALGRTILHRLAAPADLVGVATAESERFSQATGRAARDLKRLVRADLLERRERQPVDDRFLDAWFAASTRQRIGELVASLKR